MTELHELFADAASSSARPSRLVAEEVYAAGRRRHRQRLTAASAAGATALAMVTITVVSLLSPAPAPVDTPPIASPSATTGGLDPISGRQIRWVGAADRQHLYLALASCDQPPCQKQPVALVGSADGGRTWRDRSATITVNTLAVIGPDTLIADAPGPPPAERTLLTSLDGGRTWAAARFDAATEAVPDGGRAICWSLRAGDPCTLHAVNLSTGAVAPLAAQPPLTLGTGELRIEESTGGLRVAGTDPATGRPAVSTSADAGRSWSTEVLADAPACPQRGCAAPLLAVAGTAYAVTTDGSVRAVYRAEGKGDRWQRLATTRLPDEQAATEAFVTANGTPVLFQLVDGEGADEYRYWAARNGGAYQTVELDGLPSNAGPIQRTPDGWFYAPDASGTLYGSVDGWRWSPVTPR